MYITYDTLNIVSTIFLGELSVFNFLIFTLYFVFFNLFPIQKS
ncbi:hypothetical protein ACSSV5_000469 [Psychroflexus sp. MBR-150]